MMLVLCISWPSNSQKLNKSEVETKGFVQIVCLLYCPGVCRVYKVTLNCFSVLHDKRLNTDEKSRNPPIHKTYCDKHMLLQKAALHSLHFSDHIGPALLWWDKEIYFYQLYRVTRMKTQLLLIMFRSRANMIIANKPWNPLHFEPNTKLTGVFPLTSVSLDLAFMCVWNFILFYFA